MLDLIPYLPAARRHNAARALRQADNSFAAILERNLAARKARRPQLAASAHKGWETRRKRSVGNVATD
jgi:hypothetical protein